MAMSSPDKRPLSIIRTDMQCSAYLFHYYSTAIIEHLVRNGVMPLEVLYEPPFTDFHFEGLDGVRPNHADRVISIIKRVNENARAAA